MKLNRILRSGLVAVAAALAASDVQAQTGTARPTWAVTGPLSLEGYYAHYRLDASGDERFGMNGVGARLLWNGPAHFAGLRVVPSRAAIGVFAEYAPTARGFSILHAGAQGDVRLSATPLFGRATPIASMALGALWTDVDNEADARATAFPLAQERTTTFAVTPSLGVRVGLWRELGLRADVRDVVTFSPTTLHNLQFATGLSVSF